MSRISPTRAKSVGDAKVRGISGHGMAAVAIEASAVIAKYRPEFQAAGFEELEAVRAWAASFVR